MNENPQKTARNMCRDVQPLLYDYSVHELGPARSEFVREHVRRCDVCRSELASIQKTLAVLNLAREAPIPGHLSVSHRKRMSQAIMHPVLDWICRNSVIVAVAAMVIAVVLSVIILRKAMDSEAPENYDMVPIELSPRAKVPVPETPPPLPPLQEDAK